MARKTFSSLPLASDLSIFKKLPTSPCPSVVVKRKDTESIAFHVKSWGLQITETKSSWWSRAGHLLENHWGFSQHPQASLGVCQEIQGMLSSLLLPLVFVSWPLLSISGKQGFCLVCFLQAHLCLNSAWHIAVVCQHMLPLFPAGRLPVFLWGCGQKVRGGYPSVPQFPSLKFRLVSRIHSWLGNSSRGMGFSSKYDWGRDAFAWKAVSLEWCRQLHTPLQHLGR